MFRPPILCIQAPTCAVPAIAGPTASAGGVDDPRHERNLPEQSFGTAKVPKPYSRTPECTP